MNDLVDEIDNLEKAELLQYCYQGNHSRPRKNFFDENGTETLTCRQCLERRKETRKELHKIKQQQRNPPTDFPNCVQFSNSILLGSEATDSLINTNLKSRLAHILPKPIQSSEYVEFSSTASYDLQNTLIPVSDGVATAPIPEAKVSPTMAPQSNLEINVPDDISGIKRIPTGFDSKISQLSFSPMTTAKFIVMLRSDPTPMPGVTILSARILYIWSPTVNASQIHDSYPSSSDEINEIVCIVCGHSAENTEQNRHEYAKTIKLDQIRGASTNSTIVYEDYMSTIEFTHMVIDKLISTREDKVSLKIAGDFPLMTRRSVFNAPNVLVNQMSLSASCSFPENEDCIENVEKEDEPDFLRVSSFQEMRNLLSSMKDQRVHIRARFMMQDGVSEIEFLTDLRVMILESTGYHFTLNRKRISKRGIISSHCYYCSQDASKKRKNEETKGMRRCIKMTRYDCNGYLRVSLSLITKLVNLKMRHYPHPPYMGSSKIKSEVITRLKSMDNEDIGVKPADYDDEVSSEMECDEKIEGQK